MHKSLRRPNSDPTGVDWYEAYILLMKRDL